MAKKGSIVVKSLFMILILLSSCCCLPVVTAEPLKKQIKAQEEFQTILEDNEQLQSLFNQNKTLQKNIEDLLIILDNWNGDKNQLDAYLDNLKTPPALKILRIVLTLIFILPSLGLALLGIVLTSTGSAMADGVWSLVYFFDSIGIESPVLLVLLDSFLYGMLMICVALGLGGGISYVSLWNLLRNVIGEI